MYACWLSIRANVALPLLIQVYIGIAVMETTSWHPHTFPWPLEYLVYVAYLFCFSLTFDNSLVIDSLRFLFKLAYQAPTFP
jgi:hypothetical protein